MKMKSKLALGRIVAMLLAILCTAIVGAVIYYFALPAFTIYSAGFWWFVVSILVFWVLFALVANSIRKDKTSDWGKKGTNIIVWIPLGILALILVAFLVTSMFNWQMFHANQYANLVEPTDGNYNDDIFELNENSAEVVIVDQEVAKKLGDRTIGSIENAGWFEADDEYNLVEVNDTVYRLSPVNYGSLFKYNKARYSGIPGYILVDAKTEEAEFIKLEEGIQYSPSAYWSHDLKRHLRSQYPCYTFGKSFFEIDDEYVPYWITPVRTSRIGLFGAKMTSSVVITNAITGKSVEYAVKDLPDWVDHVDSVSYLIEMTEYHYRYQNGWWNPSHTGVFHTSYYYRSTDENKYTPFAGYNSLIAKDGRVWFYTGLTPANAAETNVAFLLISPKTGEVRKYEINGAEESSAQAAAEGLVQNLKYSASFPTIVNIDGVETYFMLLKDDAGLVQRYALCNVAQYSKVVQEETLEAAIRSYKIKLGMSVEDSSNSVLIPSDEETPIVDAERHNTTGVVKDVAQAEINGYSYYYFTVVDMNDVVFQSSIRNSNLQPLKLVKGASVTIEYYDSQVEVGLVIVTKIQFN